jgi:hypothetical protein
LEVQLKNPRDDSTLNNKFLTALGDTVKAFDEFKAAPAK